MSRVSRLASVLAIAAVSLALPGMARGQFFPMQGNIVPNSGFQHATDPGGFGLPPFGPVMTGPKFQGAETTATTAAARNPLAGVKGVPNSLVSDADASIARSNTYNAYGAMPFGGFANNGGYVYGAYSSGYGSYGYVSPSQFAGYNANGVAGSVNFNGGNFNGGFGPVGAAPGMQVDGFAAANSPAPANDAPVAATTNQAKSSKAAKAAAAKASKAAKAAKKK